MKIYDLAGNEHERLGVDARECVEALGWTLEPAGRLPEILFVLSDEPAEPAPEPEKRHYHRKDKK